MLSALISVWLGTILITVVAARRSGYNKAMRDTDGFALMPPEDAEELDTRRKLLPGDGSLFRAVKDTLDKDRAEITSLKIENRRLQKQVEEIEQAAADVCEFQGAGDIYAAWNGFLRWPSPTLLSTMALFGTTYTGISSVAYTTVCNTSY